MANAIKTDCELNNIRLVDLLNDIFANVRQEQLLDGTPNQDVYFRAAQNPDTGLYTSICIITPRPLTREDLKEFYELFSWITQRAPYPGELNEEVSAGPRQLELNLETTAPVYTPAPNAMALH